MKEAAEKVMEYIPAVITQAQFKVGDAVLLKAPLAHKPDTSVSRKLQPRRSQPFRVTEELPFSRFNVANSESAIRNVTYSIVNTRKSGIGRERGNANVLATEEQLSKASKDYAISFEDVGRSPRETVYLRGRFKHSHLLYRHDHKYSPSDTQQPNTREGTKCHTVFVGNNE